MKFKKLIALLSCAVLTSMTMTGCGSAPTSATGISGSAAIIEDITTIQAFKDEAVAEADITSIVNAGVNAPSSMNGQPWHFTVVTDKSTLEDIAGGMSGGFSRPSGGSGEKPEGFDKGEKPEGFDPSNMPEGFNKDSMPEGFDASKFPEGFDKDSRPEGMPEGFDKDSIPEGFDASNLPEGFDKDKIPSGGSDKGDKPAAPAGGSDSTAAKAGITDAPLVVIISCKSGSELDAGLATQNMSAEAALLGYGTKIISSPTIALNGANKEEYKQKLGIPDDMSAVCMLLIGKVDTENYDAVSSATTRKSLNELITYIK